MHKNLCNNFSNKSQNLSPKVLTIFHFFWSTLYFSSNVNIENITKFPDDINKSHCLGSLIWIKKSILSRDCYSSQIYTKTEWNLLKLKSFNWLFNRKLNFCVLPRYASEKIKGMGMVHHYCLFMMNSFYRKKYLVK